MTEFGNQYNKELVPIIYKKNSFESQIFMPQNVNHIELNMGKGLSLIYDFKNAI